MLCLFININSKFVGMVKCMEYTVVEKDNFKWFESYIIIEGLKYCVYSYRFNEMQIEETEIGIEIKLERNIW